MQIKPTPPKYFLVISFALILFYSSIGQSIFRSVLFSSEFVSSNNFKPIRHLTAQPEKEEVRVFSQGRYIKADIYKPKDNRKHPAAVVAIGLDLPKAHPISIQLASALARTGYITIIPDIDDLLNTRYKPEEVEDFVSLFQFLQTQPNVDSTRVGFVGFCIGSPLSLLAAEDPRIADRVFFVSTAAILYDLFTLSRDVQSETVNDINPTYHWQPDPKTRKVIATEFTDYLNDNNEKKIIVDSILKNTPLDEPSQNNLSPDAQAIYLYLQNKDPQKAQALWDKLPERGRARLAKISPKTYIKNLKAKTFIVSGKEVYLPKSQAIQLAQDLPKNQRVFSEIEAFSHTRFIKENNISKQLIQDLKVITHIAKLIYYTKPFSNVKAN